MSFDELYARWAFVNYNDPISSFESWIDGLFDLFLNDGIGDNYTDEIAYEYTEVFNADEVRFLFSQLIAA